MADNCWQLTLILLWMYGSHVCRSSLVAARRGEVRGSAVPVRRGVVASGSWRGQVFDWRLLLCGNEAVIHEKPNYVGDGRFRQFLDDL